MPKRSILDRLAGRRRHSQLVERGSRRERTKFLPSDLAEQISEAAEAEREWLLARIEEIDASIELLCQWRAEAQVTLNRSYEVIEPPAVKRRRLDGSVRIEKPRLYRVVGKAAIEAGQVVRKIERHIAAFRLERQDRIRQISEANRVQDHAERGVISALLTITANWRNRVAGIGEIAPLVKLGRSYPTDAAGYRLSPSALDEDGRPLPLPDWNPHSSQEPLVIEEG